MKLILTKPEVNFLAEAIRSDILRKSAHFLESKEIEFVLKYNPDKLVRKALKEAGDQPVVNPSEEQQKKQVDPKVQQLTGQIKQDALELGKETQNDINTNKNMLSSVPVPMAGPQQPGFTSMIMNSMRMIASYQIAGFGLSTLFNGIKMLFTAITTFISKMLFGYKPELAPDTMGSAVDASKIGMDLRKPWMAQRAAELTKQGIIGPGAYKPGIVIKSAAKIPVGVIAKSVTLLSFIAVKILTIIGYIGAAVIALGAAYLVFKLLAWLVHGMINMFRNFKTRSVQNIKSGNIQAVAQDAQAMQNKIKPAISITRKAAQMVPNHSENILNRINQIEKNI